MILARCDRCGGDLMVQMANGNRSVKDRAGDGRTRRLQVQEGVEAPRFAVDLCIPCTEVVVRVLAGSDLRELFPGS